MYTVKSKKRGHNIINNLICNKIDGIVVVLNTVYTVAKKDLENSVLNKI